VTPLDLYELHPHDGAARLGLYQGILQSCHRKASITTDTVEKSLVPRLVQDAQGLVTRPIQYDPPANGVPPHKRPKALKGCYRWPQSAQP
jgi:hypothetical protein